MIEEQHKQNQGEKRVKISKTGFPFSQPLKRPEHLPPREKREGGKKKGRQQTGPSHPQHQREQHWSGGIGSVCLPSRGNK